MSEVNSPSTSKQHFKRPKSPETNRNGGRSQKMIRIDKGGALDLTMKPKNKDGILQLPDNIQLSDTRLFFPSKIIVENNRNEAQPDYSDLSKRKTMYCKPIKLETPNINLLQNINLFSVQVSNPTSDEVLQYTFKVSGNMAGQAELIKINAKNQNASCNCGCGNRAIYHYPYNPALYTQAKIKFESAWNKKKTQN